MTNTLEFGNPYGAGRYLTIRSSTDVNAMTCGSKAPFDANCGRYFEYYGGGYSCGRDGQAFQEQDDIDIETFKAEHPGAHYRETHYDFVYGNTREEVADAFFYLHEYAGYKYRGTGFSLDDLSMEEAMAYAGLLEDWHRTGNIDARLRDHITDWKWRDTDTRQLIENAE